jgi:hypothetical protein
MELYIHFPIPRIHIHVALMLARAGREPKNLNAYFYAIGRDGQLRRWTIILERSY